MFFLWPWKALNYRFVFLSVRDMVFWFLLNLPLTAPKSPIVWQYRASFMCWLSLAVFLEKGRSLFSTLVNRIDFEAMLRVYALSTIRWFPKSVWKMWLEPTSPRCCRVVGLKAKRSLFCFSTWMIWYLLLIWIFGYLNLWSNPRFPIIYWSFFFSSSAEFKTGYELAAMLLFAPLSVVASPLFSGLASSYPSISFPCFDFLFIVDY